MHARLKNKFMEDEKCHNLMSWLKNVLMDCSQAKAQESLHVHPAKNWISLCIAQSDQSLYSLSARKSTGSIECSAKTDRRCIAVEDHKSESLLAAVLFYKFCYALAQMSKAF